MHPSQSAIKKSNDDLRILLDNIQTQVWYLSDPYKYGAVNRAHADFNGCHPEEMAYRKIAELFPADVAEICIQVNKEVFDSGNPVTTEEWLANSSGEMRLLSIYKVPVLNPDSSVDYVVCSAEDITERRVAEEALTESEARFRLITEKTKDVLWVLDIESMRLVYVSPSIVQLRGFSPEEVTAIPFASAIAEPSRASVLEALRQGIEDFRTGSEPPDKVYRVEYQLPHKDGYLIWVESICSFTLKEKSGRLELRGVTRDITERKKSAEQLLRAKLTAESVKIKYQVEQQERTKLSRDLHDGIGQTLQGIRLQLKLLERQHAENWCYARITELAGELDSAIEELREITRSMRPAHLNETTLRAAIEALCFRMSEKGLPIKWHLADSIPDLPPQTKDHIYRIAQEALSNAARHSEGDSVNLSLDNTAGILTLVISDNGKGFSAAENPSDGCGLAIMKERAAMLFASITIESGSNGTTLTLEVPLNDQNSDS